MAEELRIEAQGEEQEPEPSYPYVVRGAQIYCNCGSHVRRLDMPVSHGSFIRDKAMMNKADCKVGLDQNIPPFGACQAPGNQGMDIIIEDPKDVLPGMPVPVKGKLCAPKLAGQWLDAQDNTLVDGKPALTVKCTIACCFGGIIEFMDAGQEVY